MKLFRKLTWRQGQRLGGIFSTCLAISGFFLIQQPAMADETLWKNHFEGAIKSLQENAPAAAEKQLLSALEQAKPFGEKDQRYWKTLDALAITYTSEKKFREADKTFAKVLSIKKQILGPDSPELSLTTSLYADLLFSEGKYKQAEAMYQSSIANLAKMNAAVFAEKSQNYGLCLEVEALYPQAEEALQNAKKKEVELYGDSSTQALSTDVNLINMHISMGLYKQAEEEANQVFSKLNKSPTKDAHLIDACLAALESIDSHLAHYDKAEEKAKTIIANAEQRHDPNSADYPRSLERLADVYVEEKRFAEAEPLLHKAKNILEKQTPGHPNVADALVDLGELYIDLGKYNKAETLIQQALTIRQAALGDEHPDVAECLIDLAYIEAQTNRSSDAESTYKKALTIKEISLGKNHPSYARALCKLGLLYAAMHRNADAESALTEALSLREKNLPPEHPDIAQNMAELAGFYKDNNMPQKAADVYKRLSARDEKYDPSNTAAKLSDLNNLAAVMSTIGNASNATQMKAKAKELRRSLPGGQSDPNDLALLKASAGSTPPVTDKWCLCIGISNFKDPTINLKYSAKDATDFRNFLLTQGNFKEDHIKLLTDEDATRENILNQLGEKWLGQVAKPTDLVVIYISSHGSTAMQKAGGTNFLVAYDTNKNSLLASGIPMQWLSEMVKEQMKSNRTLLILDVCHSGSVTDEGKSAAPTASAESGGAGGKGLTRDFDINVTKLTAGDGQIILCSSAADQVSWESKEYPNSVFTKKLIESLQIKGVDTHLTDAYKVMKSKVEEEVLRDRAVVQTPMIKENWQGGEVAPLARAQ